MGQIKSFKDLVVWQVAMNVVFDVYEIIKKLPKHEVYVLSDQIRRSAISIPSNIAEGSKRNNRKEFHHFCGIAQGSAAELETQLLIIQQVYPAVPTRQTLANILRIQMMLTKLCQQLRGQAANDPPLTNHES